MLAVDTNILVYAHLRAVPEWQRAYEIMQNLAEGSRDWAIPWPCCYEFLGVVTNRRAWREDASSRQEAWRQLGFWADSPSFRFIGETDNFLDVLGDVVLHSRVSGPKIHDARIAAICVAHGVEALLTRDRDFSNFPQLRSRNPFDD